MIVEPDGKPSTPSIDPEKERPEKGNPVQIRDADGCRDTLQETKQSADGFQVQNGEPRPFQERPQPVAGVAEKVVGLIV